VLVGLKKKLQATERKIDALQAKQAHFFITLCVAALLFLLSSALVNSALLLCCCAAVMLYLDLVCFVLVCVLALLYLPVWLRRAMLFALYCRQSCWIP
jgi:hypothetical protein